VSSLQKRNIYIYFSVRRYRNYWWKQKIPLSLDWPIVFLFIYFYVKHMHPLLACNKRNQNHVGVFFIWLNQLKLLMMSALFLYDIFERCHTDDTSLNYMDCLCHHRVTCSIEYIGYSFVSICSTFHDSFKCISHSFNFFYKNSAFYFFICKKNKLIKYFMYSYFYINDCVSL